MDLSVWLAFFAASAALLIVPGPTVLPVLSDAVEQGQRAAGPTALGVAGAGLVVVILALAGLGALVATSATLFTVLKLAGAAYLVWRGVKMLRGAKRGVTVHAVPGQLAARRTVGDFATFTALNPKSIAFLVAFMLQFVDPAAPLLAQSAILVATFVGLAALNALGFAVMAAGPYRAIRRPAVLTWLARIGGVVPIAMGVASATPRRQGV